MFELVILTIVHWDDTYRMEAYSPNEQLGTKRALQTTTRSLNLVSGQDSGARRRNRTIVMESKDWQSSHRKPIPQYL